MNAMIVDGNVLAGVLSELFESDATMLTGVCAGCGAEALLAEAVVEIDDVGTIVRCRSCTHTLLTVLRTPGETRVLFGSLRELRGSR